MNLGESAPLKLLIRREGVVAADQDELREAMYGSWRVKDQ